MYYRNAAAAIVCFDITNSESFMKMQDWVEELDQNVRDTIKLNCKLCRYLSVLLLVGTCRPTTISDCKQ
jgi:GTPase SAR1 family protein